MLKKIFYFCDRDGHYIFQVLGLIQISIKHKCNFKYVEATEYGLTKEKRNPQLIVSLTTFPARINTVHLTINTLLRQSFKPDKLILWLADSQFPAKEDELPENLLKLRELGLEIKWTADIKSYKKLIPALKEFPEDIIVTVDDDLYYEEKCLEKLYNAYEKDKNNIYVHRVARIMFDGQNLKYYSQRESIFLDFPKPSYANSIFGGSGCLYPPHSLHPDVFDIEKARKLTYNADDYWFWAMSVLGGTKISEVSGSKSNLQIIEGTVESSMYKNGPQLDYNEIFSNLTEEYNQILKRIME